MKRFPIFRSLLAFTFLTLGGVHRSPAANVTWGAATSISAETDVSTAGSLVYAYTMGNADTTATTLNGVTFSTFAVPLGTSDPVVVDARVRLTVSFNSTFFADDEVAGADTAPFTTLSPAYQNLLKGGVSTNLIDTDVFAPVVLLTMGGLTAGQQYQVQFWSSDSYLMADSTGQTVFTAGSNSVALRNNTLNTYGGVGQWVAGTFVANDTTQVFSVSPSDPINALVLTAFQLRAVPEPHEFAVAIVALLGGIIFVRRWRQVA